MSNHKYAEHSSHPGPEKNKSSPSALMWAFTIILVVGLFMVIANLHGKCLFSKYDGVIMSFIGVGASIWVAVGSRKPVKELFVGSAGMSEYDYY